MAKSQNEANSDEFDTDICSTEIFGELDVFGKIGLGLGASDRARELVIKGLLYEYKMHTDVLEYLQKRKRGRPRNLEPSIDVLRAAAVLSADDLWRDRTGKGLSTQLEAIHLARKIDHILVAEGEREKPLFPQAMTTQKRLQDSVSAGLTELGLSWRFSKKSE